MPFDPIGGFIGAVGGIAEGIGKAIFGGGGKPKTEIPEAPDVEAELRPSGTALVEGQREAEEAEFAAAEKDQARYTEEGERVQAEKGAFVEDVEDVRTALRGDEIAVRQAIATQQGKLEQIPGAVRSEFDSLRAEFDVSATQALGRGEKQRVEALAGVYEGQGAALQSAVQGIQGNINTQVSQIQSNPNLTSAQKQSMISQVQMQGASALAPAVGETILAFNELSAATAVSFGEIAGNLEGTILGVKGELAGAAGTAFANAQVAVGELTNQLVEVQANATIEFAATQNQLLATRNIAENSANDIMTQLLPGMSTPYLDITGSLSTQYALDVDILTRGFQMELQEAGLNLQLEAFNEANPPFPFNLIGPALSFFGIG